MTLRRGRIAEIGIMFNGGSDNGSFPCHETIDYSNDEGRETEKTQHCAGALIFAEKHERPTQMMRICERLGFYDPRKLEDEDKVWDDIDEWLDNGSCG